jgi:hypothetical protein
MSENHSGLPIGYSPQSVGNIEMVNRNKELEEHILRVLDEFRNYGVDIDQRWLAIGRTHIEEGFMAVNRAIFRPARIKLPAD